MYKILTKFLIAAAGIFCLNSCNLSMYGTYTFQHGGRYHVLEENEETTGKALEEYFTSVIDFEKEETFTGTSYDATQYGYNLFVRTAEKIDRDYVLRLLRQEIDENGEVTDEEWVEYTLVMTNGKSYRTVIGYYTIVAGQDDEESGSVTMTDGNGQVWNL